MDWSHMKLPPLGKNNYPKNPFKQEPDYTIQAITSQNRTRPTA
jgi:hypothetical protein